MLKKYILDSQADPYFSNIVWFIRQQCFNLDSVVINSTNSNKGKLEDLIDELIDYFYYLHDIFNLGIPELSRVLSEQMLKYLLVPHLVGSLFSEKVDEKNMHVELEDRISPMLSVFLLTQIFYIFKEKQLVNSLASVLVYENFESKEKANPTNPNNPPSKNLKESKDSNYVKHNRRSSDSLVISISTKKQ